MLFKVCLYKSVNISETDSETVCLLFTFHTCLRLTELGTGMWDYSFVRMYCK